MGQTAQTIPSRAKDRAEFLAHVAEIARTEVKPLAPRIDAEGLYPAEILRKLGTAGAFAQHLSRFSLAGGHDLKTAAEAMAAVGEYCGCSSFLMWLQNAFGWYLEVTENATLREDLQGPIAAAELFGSSGMSNPVKALDGIEDFKLRGERVSGGYIVSGVLPYVSNLGDGHFFGTAFELADKPGHRVMAVLRVDGESVKIAANAHFIALEGSGTFSAIVKRHFVADAMVLADPIAPFAKKIKPAFFLLQAGMALGQIRGCVALMRAADRRLEHVNRHLPHRPDWFEERTAALAPTLAALMRSPLDGSPDYVKAVYRARLDAGDLAMQAATSAMMHVGAQGYLKGSEADRRLRETIFVAIVTPALKHLRKTLAEA